MSSRTRDRAFSRLLERMQVLLKAWFSREVRLMPARPMPAHAYDHERRQLRIVPLVANLVGRLPEDALLVLAITDRDLYLKGFDHALGWGSLEHGVAIMSTARLGREFAERNRSSLFEALKVYLEGDGAGPGYAEQAEALGMTTGLVKVSVHRLRRRFRELLQTEVEHTLADIADANDEIGCLLASLAAQ